MKFKINHVNKYNKIITKDAQVFLLALVNKFSDRINSLMLKREKRQDRYDTGELPNFLSETQSIRESDWQVALIPDCILDRRVEITGPPDRKMIINALNSGAKVYMSDFEDSLSPTWYNVMTAQVNLKDAVRGTIEYTHPTKGKTYKLNNKPAVLFVRPRGLHLWEKHVEINEKLIRAALFDFGLYAYHNANYLYEIDRGPFFYIPKLEHHSEAKLWDDIFSYTEEYFDIKRGSIKATVLIETLPAAFQMNEILYALKDHSAGLNCGRWDYIFSYIKTFRAHPEHVLPDREKINMNVHFMRSYSELLVQTCHNRGAHAMGGMAAQIPIKGDKEANDNALEKVRQDKLVEVTRGHDGTWVAHPGLIPIAMNIFNNIMPQNNQISHMVQHSVINQADLLRCCEGEITLPGIRKNIEVGVQYLASWIAGNGCVPINNLMEDAATAEISRAQLWQWVKHKAITNDGQIITSDLVSLLIDEYVNRITNILNNKNLNDTYNDAGAMFKKMTMKNTLENFLTIRAYDKLTEWAK